MTAISNRVYYSLINGAERFALIKLMLIGWFKRATVTSPGLLRYYLLRKACRVYYSLVLLCEAQGRGNKNRLPRNPAKIPGFLAMTDASGVRLFRAFAIMNTPMRLPPGFGRNLREFLRMTDRCFAMAVKHFLSDTLYCPVCRS